MADLGYISRQRALEGRAEGARPEALRHLLRTPPALLLRLRRGQADRKVRRQHRPQGRAQGLHDDRPEAAGSRAGSDELDPPLLRRPGLGAGLDRTRNRLHQGDGLELELRRQPVQPRRPGPPAAGLDLQDLRPDDGDQAGRRPLLDLLHLETAQPRPAGVGALGGPHRRRGIPGDDQPPAGDRRLRQHRLRPARPRRRARERRRNREVDGHRNRTRRDPGRGDRRPPDRRLAARDVGRLRDARLGRHPPQPDRDPPGRLPRRPRRPSRARRTEAGRSPKRSPTR